MKPRNAFLFACIGLFLLAGTGSVGGLALAFSGDPRACGTGDAGVLTAADLRAATRNVRAISLGGRRITYSEQAATQLARAYVRAHHDDFTDIKVGFCGGHTEASGTWRILTGVRGMVATDVSVRNGRLEYKIRDARVGRLPGWASVRLARRVASRTDMERFALPPVIAGVEVGAGTMTFTSR